MKNFLIISLALMSFMVFGSSNRYVDLDFLTSADLTKTWTPPATTDTLMGRAQNETVSGTKTFSSQIVSTVSTGTAPLSVSSTTKVTNLYADRAALADSATTNANLTGPITSVGNATSVASQTGTGSKFVMDTSPTLVTPNIGAATGSSLSVTGQLTSTVSTGTSPLAVSSTTKVTNLYADRAALADTTTTNANLTGPITSSGNATSVASQTGTGSKFVMDTSPTLVTPNIGVATATSVNSTTIPSSKTLETKDTLTTKGDLYVATGATTTARQAAGANDTELVADSTQTNGLAYRTAKAKGNLLNNWSFEQATVDNNWTITGGGTSASSTTNLQDGAQSLIRTSTGAWSVIQDVTTFATGKSGQDAEIYVWVYSATANADMWLCPRTNGASVTASVANGCMQYTNLGGSQKLTVYPLFGSTSTGAEIKGSGAITYALDDAYLGDRRPSVQGITTTPWAPCSFSTLTWSGFGVVTNNLLCSRVGENLKIKGKWTNGTVAASLGKIPLPNNWGSLTVNSSVVSNMVIAGGFRDVAATSSMFNFLISPSTSYVSISNSSLVAAANNPATAVNGNTATSTGETISITGEMSIPIAEWKGDTNALTTKCDDPRQCEKHFSANVTSTSGAVSGQTFGTNFPWVSCSAANPTVCTFTSGLFTTTPNCSPSGPYQSNVTLRVESVSSSSVSIRTINATNGTDVASVSFTLTCDKQGADALLAQLTQQVVQMRDVPTISETGAPKIFGLSQSGVSACSTTPCTPTQRINTSVIGSTYTRNSAGSYTVPFTGITTSICNVTTTAIVSQSNRCQLESVHGGADAKVLCFNSSNTPTDEGWSMNCVGY